MQIKTVRYHFTPTRIAILKEKNPRKVTSTIEDVEILEPLCTAGGNVKRCRRYGKQYMVIPQKIKHSITV